ncbi:pilin [Pseudonocardia nigra]|uniref:pilin n=1 Tax=Pseudonocardia nigra TaxID=1921578 RepID=UPI001C603814|nr:pilin [Pseudonocardia nigra]
MRVNRHTPRPAGRRRRTHRALVVAAVVAGSLLTTTAAASGADGRVVLAQAESVEQVLDNVRGWIVGILALLATVFLTIGGVRYILGGGDPGEIEKAKVAFRSACVGYALAVLAPLVVTVLQGIVGA